MGFADQTTEVLLALRANLLQGLDRIAEHVEAGTLLVIPPGASAPPAEFGYVIVMLLEQVEMELHARGRHAEPSEESSAAVAGWCYLAGSPVVAQW